MEENKHVIKLGNNAMLIYQADPPSELDIDFLKRLKAVEASLPPTAEDFFNRLSQMPKQSVDAMESAAEKIQKPPIDEIKTDTAGAQRQPLPANRGTILIELKNIKVAHHLSEETTAFTANLYINGEKIAFVKNEGYGGNTHYEAYQQKDIDILNDAETYCKALPPTIYNDTIIDGKPLTVPMDLENYIDSLLYDHLDKKELERFQKKMQKDQVDSIVFGARNKEYSRLKFKYPLAQILQSPNGLESLKKHIQEKVLPELKEGQTILNTNLPAELLQLERKRPQKPATQIDEPPDKKKGLRH